MVHTVISGVWLQNCRRIHLCDSLPHTPGTPRDAFAQREAPEKNSHTWTETTTKLASEQKAEPQEIQLLNTQDQHLSTGGCWGAEQAQMGMAGLVWSHPPGPGNKGAYSFQSEWEAKWPGEATHKMQRTGDSCGSLVHKLWLVLPLLICCHHTWNCCPSQYLFNSPFIKLYTFVHIIDAASHGLGLGLDQPHQLLEAEGRGYMSFWRGRQVFLPTNKHLIKDSPQEFKSAEAEEPKEQRDQKTV